MGVRRAAVAGLVGLALVVGAGGCGKISEKVAEEAVERNSNCSDVDIDAADGGFSGNCDGQDIDANVSGNAELPDGWPADLTPPEGLQIITSTGSAGPPQAFNVIGGIDGDVTTVYEGIKAQLTAAGYTIDSDNIADTGSGPAGTLAATGPEFTATVSVGGDPGAVEGNVVVAYNLTAVA